MEGQQLVEMKLLQLNVLRQLVYIYTTTVAMILYSPCHNSTGSLSTGIPPDAACL